jgi:hypothetical protein
MKSTIDIRHVIGTPYRKLLTGAVPIAAFLEMAIASAPAYAQTKPGVDCVSTPQKAGEGAGQYGAGYMPPQKPTAALCKG